MYRPSPLPANREVFLDARGDGRALRATWHSEAGVVVFSLWRDRVCAGTFRLPVEDAPVLIEMLRSSLEQAYDDARDSFDDARGSFLARFEAPEDEVG
jgi:hypothetical protein